MRHTLNVLLLALVATLCLGGCATVYDTLTSELNNLAPTAMTEPTEEATQEAMEEPTEEPTTASTTENSYTDFTMENAEGDLVNLSDFVGEKTVVLNFWASWCGPCKEEMPHFSQAETDYADKDVVFIMLNQADGEMETKDIAMAYLEKEGLAFTHMFFDTTGEASTAYGITGIPTTVFIDKNGQMIDKVVGSMDQEYLFGALDDILGL